MNHARQLTVCVGPDLFLRNLLMGDQSDEDRIRLARRINPTAVADAMAKEFEAARRLWSEKE